MFTKLSREYLFAACMHIAPNILQFISMCIFSGRGIWPSCFFYILYLVVFKLSICLLFAYIVVDIIRIICWKYFYQWF